MAAKLPRVIFLISWVTSCRQWPLTDLCLHSLHSTNINSSSRSSYPAGWHLAVSVYLSRRNQVSSHLLECWSTNRLRCHQTVSFSTLSVSVSLSVRDCVDERRWWFYDVVRHLLLRTIFWLWASNWNFKFVNSNSTLPARAAPSSQKNIRCWVLGNFGLTISPTPPLILLGSKIAKFCLNFLPPVAFQSPLFRNAAVRIAGTSMIDHRWSIYIRPSEIWFSSAHSPLKKITIVWLESRNRIWNFKFFDSTFWACSEAASWLVFRPNLKNWLRRFARLCLLFIQELKRAKFGLNFRANSHFSWIIGQMFAFDRRYLSLTCSRWISELKIVKFRLKKLETSLSIIIRSEMYFDILNRVGVAHEGDRRTDRQNRLQ